MTVGLGLAKVAYFVMAVSTVAIIVAAISALFGETKFPGPFTLPDAVDFWAYLGQTLGLIAAAWLFRATVGVGLVLLGTKILPREERELRDALFNTAREQGYL